MEAPQLGPALLEAGRTAGRELVARWRKRIAMLHMVRTGEVIDSVEAHISPASHGLALEMRTVDRAKFSDWGVGRGRPLRDPSTGLYTRRKHRKRFYSPHIGDDSSLFLRRVRALLAERAQRLLDELDRAARQASEPVEL